MNTTILSDKELQIIRENLPAGAKTRIKKLVNVSYKQIQNILEGKHQNIEVIDLAIKEIERRDQLRQKVSQIKNQYNETV